MPKQAEIINLLRELISFQSITPNDAGSLEFIANYFQDLGATSTWLKRGVTTNLLLSLGAGSCVFAFAGHVDVVPCGDTTLWHGGNPFELQTNGEQLIGRGVADMKGAIAAFMVAVREFIAATSLTPDDYRIMLLLTSDEEGSAIDGTPVLVEYLQQQGIGLDYCLVGEPSCVNQLGDTIKVGRRGSLTGELIIRGKQGHIAYPHLCDNPIHSFAPALAELATYQWDEGNQFFPATSLQFANINAGLGATNVIPGSLTTNFNFRYNNLHTVDDLQNKVQSILDSHHLNYQLNWIHSASPFLTPVGKLVEYCQAAIYQECQILPQLKTDGGTSDGRFLIAVSNEIIEFGLLNASIHQINEATTTHDLWQLCQIYHNILDKIFND